MTQPVPRSLEAEESALGCLLINPEARRDLAFLDPADFYLHKHRWIFDSARVVEPLDIRTLSDELERRSQLAEVGGTAYLLRLMGTVPTSLHAEAYGRIIERKATRRRLLDAAGEVAKLAYAEGREMDAVLADAVRAVKSVGAGRSADSLRPASEVAAETWAAIGNPEALGQNILRTGLTAWDDALGGGFEKQTNNVLMGRPGMGKSAVLCQVADLLSERGLGVVVFSKEMSAQQWLRRMAFRRAKVNWNAYKQNRATEAEHAAVAREMGEISGRAGIYIDASANQSTDDVWRLCEKFKDDYGRLDIIIADHLRLFNDKADNETHRLGKISWAFKQIAKELDTVSLVAAQLSRAVEGRQDKRPVLADLRDSGEIEENADTVTAVYRDSLYSENDKDHTFEMIVRKARDGETNTRATFYFQPYCLSLEPLASRHIDTEALE